MIKQPVGYRNFHPDANFNFQLNRWLPYLPEAELHEAAAGISTFEDWKRVMWRFAERAEGEGRLSEAAFYYRAVEFFLGSSDPDKDKAYEKFVTLFGQVDWGVEYTRVEVPYGDNYLPAFVIEAAGETIDTLVVHGGFDSFAEELLHQVTHLSEHGFRVILFEGPGQGYPLKAMHMPMIPEWEKPVAAVLDHFSIDDCSLLGISLGGCLATRAAAHEPRVKRVIADDVLEDFFGVLTSRMEPAKAKILGRLMNWGAKGLVNRAMAKATSQDIVTAWAVDHGMHVSGTTSPYDYLMWTRHMNTRDISHKVEQDFLLLAARDDHLVPLEQFYSQAKTLTNVRSFTGRVFTAAEHASSHCHIGNQGLAHKVMLDWLLMALSKKQILTDPGASHS